MQAVPRIVSADEWRRERDELLQAEKDATRTLDALAARRRRLPMVRFDQASYVFDAPDGPTTLLELFGDQAQLAVYQFMDVGPGHFCPGCTHFSDNVTGLAALEENGVSWVTMSDMPLDQIESYRERRGWTLPFVSSRGTTFAHDTGADDGFGLSVFLRVDDDVYRTYSTSGRGVDRLLFVNNILDLAPFGRQEEWEDSPPGWPQHPTYG